MYAAFIGLALSVIALALMVWLLGDSNSSPDAQLAVRLIFCLLQLAAIIPAFYALLNCRKYGYARSLDCARVTIGFVACMGIFIAVDQNLRKEWQKNAERQRTQAVEKAMREYNADLRKDFNRNGTITDDRERLNKLRAQTKEVSDKLSGNDKKLMLANTAYLDRMQKISAAYAKIQKEMEEAQVLDASNLSSREIIAQKRAIVVRLQQQNQLMTEFIRNSNTHLENELKQQNLPEKLIAEAMAGFRAKNLPRQKIMLEIRDCDEQICQATLHVLDTLHAHFGEWRVIPPSKLVQIDDDATRNILRGFYQEITDAAKKQTAAQQRLVNSSTLDN